MNGWPHRAAVAAALGALVLVWTSQMPGPARVAVEAGQSSLPTGVVWAWGNNAAGLAGLDGRQAITSMAVVPALSEIVAVSAGRGFSLALRSDGTVWTWGTNRHGQLGDGARADRHQPRQVPGLVEIVQVAAGDFHGLAVDRHGVVHAWGLNTAGQAAGVPADEARAVPEPTIVANVPRAVAVAAGMNFSLALTADGEVWAWGGDGRGALARGFLGGRSEGPVRVAGLPLIRTIAAGSHHALAVDESGRAWGWGANAGGQLGSSSLENQARPIVLP
jgi:alpha-tubulin suppressor-like RCC1 family protein